MLTSSGRALSALAVILLVGGALLDYPELVAVGLACLLAVLSAAGWMLIRPKLVVQRSITPNRVAEGARANGVVVLRNDGNRRSPPVHAIDHLAGRRLTVSLPSLAAGHEVESTYELPTDRRGVFVVGPLTIGHADPLRLMSATRTFAGRSVLTVHPRISVVAPLPTGQARDADGPTSSDAPRGGVAFHTLREYVPGDDRRLIHWRSSAKTGTLMVRHNVVPNEPQLMVVLDTSVVPYDDASFEDAVRVAASLCAASCDAGYPLTFRTTAGVSVEVERGIAGRAALLDTMAAVQRDPADPGLTDLPRTVPQQHEISLGVVTGLPPAEKRAAVSAVQHRVRMITLVQIGDRRGHPAPVDHGVFAINADTSERFALIWNSRARR